MSRLPLLLASSVIRGSHLGESHGGVYLVDLERGSVDQKLDWNRADIDVAGRGGDRGLRGIAFHGERILIAANAGLLVFDQDFVLLERHTNPYLYHCHEICVADDHAFLAATGYDSVLAFELKTRRFVAGWHLSGRDGSLDLRTFDPSTGGGPAASHVFHINSVTASSAGIFFSGLYTPGLLRLQRDGLSLAADLPQGTHNAQPWAEGVLYNDTAADRVCHAYRGRTVGIPVPSFDVGDIVNIHRFASDIARPRFGRGLCPLGDALVAGGSSPSTVALYDLRSGTRLRQQNISMDVRNAVHGLAPWPYA